MDMTENTETTETAGKTGRSWKRRSAIAGIALTVVTIAGIGAFAIAKDRYEGGPGDFGPMGMHMGGHHGMMQNAKGGFMEYRMNRALDSVDATDEQKQKIKAIFEKARESVSDMRGEPGQMRDQVKALLDKPAIDRDAVESLRKAQLQKMDDASKIMTTAMIDAAEVLKPEQRAKLAKEMESHRPRW